MNVSITDWQIPGSDDQPIFGNTHRPECAIRGTLVCCHGFKGYKDYGFFPSLCNRAAQAGLVAHRFNFSHSGMTNRIDTFERPELFEKDTWGRQVSDLDSVMQYLRTELASDPAPVLFGHSRGGVASLLFARQREPRLSGLITAAAPDYACKLDDLQKDQLRAEGRLASPSGRTGQDLYVGLDWLKEIESDPDLYNPILAAEQVNCPTLIIHGTGDETVPAECARSLHNAGASRSRLELIENASHTFNCPNPVADDMPYNELPYATRRMIELSVEFAREQFEADSPTGG